jgi:hypothetical protein
MQHRAPRRGAKQTLKRSGYQGASAPEQRSRQPMRYCRLGTPSTTYGAVTPSTPPSLTHKKLSMAPQAARGLLNLHCLRRKVAQGAASKCTTRLYTHGFNTPSCARAHPDPVTCQLSPAPPPLSPLTSPAVPSTGFARPAEQPPYRHCMPRKPAPVHLKANLPGDPLAECTWSCVQPPSTLLGRSRAARPQQPARRPQLAGRGPGPRSRQAWPPATARRGRRPWAGRAPCGARRSCPRTRSRRGRATQGARCPPMHSPPAPAQGQAGP